MAKSRDMTEREFKTALERRKIERGFSLGGAQYYERGNLSVPVDPSWPRRTQLARLITKFDAHDAETAAKAAALLDRERCRNAYANGVTP